MARGLWILFLSGKEGHMHEMESEFGSASV